MTSAELILIRHAPADHGGRLCGRTDVPALLPAADRLAGLRARLGQVAHVVTSPALRCRQTAGALWPGRDAARDPRLWEQDFGTHEGLPFAALPDLGPLPRDALAAHRPPGGESSADMVDRVRPALDDLAQMARRDGAVAIVAHAGTVRAGLACAMDSVPPALAFEVAPCR